MPILGIVLIILGLQRTTLPADLSQCILYADRSILGDSNMYLEYTITGLNTVVPVEERNAMTMKVMWSATSSAILNPTANTSQEAVLTPVMLAGKDSYSAIASDGIYPGRTYYFRAFSRDTLGNWSLPMNNLYDSAMLLPNSKLPANLPWVFENYQTYNLRIVVPNEFMVDAQPGVKDSDDIEGVGIWILNYSKNPQLTDATDFNRIVRSLDPVVDKRFIWLDSADMDSVIDDSLLSHWTSYYIVGSPKNRFGNWGAVSITSQSVMKITTPVDSNRISQPPNALTQFSVIGMKDPDSVKVTWGLPAATYYDDSVVYMGKSIKYDSVLVYYRTDGQYPALSESSITGTKLAGFKVNSTHLGITNHSVYGVNCTSTFHFAAFVVSEVPPGYANRYSVADTFRPAPVTPPCAPQNMLQIKAVASGLGNAISVSWKWLGSASTTPENIRLLYRVPDRNDSGQYAPIPPSSYGDGLFYSENHYNVNGPGNNLDSGVLTISSYIYYKRMYLIAAFNSNLDTVWAKTALSGLPGTQWDTATTPNPPGTAPKNELSLRASQVNSRTVNLAWDDPNGTLQNLKVMVDSLTIMFGYKTAEGNNYRWVTAADTGEVLTLDSIFWSGDSDEHNPVYSNRTYYLEIAPANKYGDVIDTHALARDTVFMYVPQVDPDSLSLSTLSDTSFMVDFHKLTNNDPHDPQILDPFVDWGLILVSDTGIIDSNIFMGDMVTTLSILNGYSNHSGRGLNDTTFMARFFDLSSGGQREIIGQNLDKINLHKTYYVSVALATNRMDPGKPVFIGRIDIDSVGVEKHLVPAPDAFFIENNHPNPFNSTTLIHYGIPRSQGGQSAASFVIYDIRGKMVYCSKAGQNQPGYHEFVWNGITGGGKPLGSGIFYLDFTAGKFRKQIKLLMIK